MTPQVKSALLGLLVSIPWGWYSDLASGELGWFIARLIFVPSFAYAITVLLARRRADRGGKA